MDNLTSNLRALTNDLSEIRDQFETLTKELETKKIDRTEALSRFSQRVNYMQFLLRKMRAFVQKELVKV